MQLKGLIARGPPPNLFHVLIIRGAIIAISIVILGISAWGVDMINSPSRYLRKRQTFDIPGFGEIDLNDFDTGSVSGSGSSGAWHGEDPFALGVFVALYTSIAVGVITAFEMFLPKYTFRIGALITYILNWIFLLSTWALAASDAATAKKWNWDKADKYSKNLYAADGALAGIGALLWLLVTANTVLYVLECLKHPDSIGFEEQPTQLQATPAKVEAGYGAQAPYGQQPVQYSQYPTGPQAVPPTQ
jgi:hypothetical protein